MVCVSASPAPPPITAHVPKMTPPRLDELLGTLAHELRSPLATIVSAAQVIAFDRDMDPVVRRALTVMERQSRQALRIVDDLFDQCAGSLGKLTLRKEVVSLAEIV